MFLIPQSLMDFLVLFVRLMLQVITRRFCEPSVI